MTWIQTHTGEAMDLREPRPETVHPHDIAVALARLPRFCGHTIEPFSVAQHSVLVHDILVWLAPNAERTLRLAALLHDAHEAYMGDIPKPLCELLGAPVAQLKRRLDRVIHVRFGLPETLPEGWDLLVRQADRIALATEREWLMGPEPKPWDEWLSGCRGWPLADLSLSGRYSLAQRFRPLLDELTAKEDAP